MIMFKLLTSQKIFISSLISKFLIFFVGNKKKKISRNKINYEIDLNEGIDLSVLLNIKNERKIFNLSKRLNKNDYLNFIDIGSNIGSVTLPLAKYFYNSNIFSIEPTIYAFKKLRKNINLNPLLKKRIFLYNYFISNKKKKVNYIHSSWSFSQQNKKHPVHLGSLKKTNKKSISLDSLIKKTKKKISFIKIDVDGYELDVLKSGIKSIKKHKPIIHIEFAPYLHNEFGYSTNFLIDFIEKKIGYEIYNEDLVKVFDIKNYVKNIVNRSENFFLIKKK